MSGGRLTRAVCGGKCWGDVALKESIGACEVLGHSDKVLRVKPLRDISQMLIQWRLEIVKGSALDIILIIKPLVKIGLFRNAIFPSERGPRRKLAVDNTCKVIPIHNIS